MFSTGRKGNFMSKNVLSFCKNFRQQEDRDLTDQSERVFLQNIPLTCWLTQSLLSLLVFIFFKEI